MHNKRECGPRCRRIKGDFELGSDRDDDGAPPSKRPKSGSDRGGDANVGEALRAVYRDAVAETIPNEMLDLLNKLD